MIKKNDELIGTVVSVGSNGEGIIKEDGIVVFVPFSLLGEKIKYKVLKVTSKCAYAKVVEVLEPSADRVLPKCCVYGKCGGCQLQHVNYDAQLKIKEDNVANCFKKIAGLEVLIKPTVRSGKEFGYRNKLQLPIEQTINGAIIGFYAENSHRVIEIDSCPINPEWTTKIIRAFKCYIENYELKGYAKGSRWDIREITVKEIDENLIITAVVSSENIKGIQYLIDKLTKEFNNKFSLFINVNNNDNNVIYGEKFILKHGQAFYESESLGIKSKFGVQSFKQINNYVCERLYNDVATLVNLDNDTTIIDAYSGAGLLTNILAKHAKKVYGIEIIKEAVFCANETSERNGISQKVQNICGKCEEIMPDIITKERQQGNKICLVLDPPRKGCEYSVIDTIINNKIDKVIYISCMPSTLARDIGLLCGSLCQENGEIKKSKMVDLRYNISSIQTYDMFPQTKHVETVVLLERKV